MAYKSIKKITNTFNSFSNNDIFTSFTIFDIAFKEEYQTQKNRKKVNNFIQQRVKSKHIIKLPTKDSSRLINYQKIRDILPQKIIRIKGCEKYFYIMLPFWNKLGYGAWVSCRGFLKYITTGSGPAFKARQVSIFLQQISYNHFCDYKISKQTFLYRKLHSITVKDMENNFIKFRTVSDNSDKVEKVETTKPVENKTIIKQAEDKPYVLSLQEVYNSIKEVQKDVQNLSGIIIDLKTQLEGIKTVQVVPLIKST